MLVNTLSGIKGDCMPNTNIVSLPSQNTGTPSFQLQEHFAVRCIAAVKEKRTGMNQPGDELRFLVLSATQSGKTFAMVSTSQEYKKAFLGRDVNQGEDFMIVFISFSAKDVNLQTIDDFVKAGFDRAVMTWCGNKMVNHYIHPGNALKKGTTVIIDRIQKIRKEGGHIIFINDEADHSTGGSADDSGKFVSQIRNFVNQHKLPLFDTQPPPGRKSWEVGFHITASVAHLHELITDSSFIPDLRPEYFQLDKSYSGLDTLNAREFIYDNKRYLGKSKREDLVNLVLSQEKEDYEKEDPCYHIVRCQDNSLRSKLKAAWNGAVEEYDCSGKGRRIVDLSQRLDEKPDVPTLILLKQGFSRGSRIHTVDHIRTLFDDKKNNDAAVLQSLVGRMTGRKSGPEPKSGEPDNRPLRRHSYHERLKIYCDTSAVSKELPAIEAQREDSHIDYIEYLRTRYPGMSGTHAKKSSRRLRSYKNPYVFKVCDSFEDHQIEVGKLGQLSNNRGEHASLSLNVMSKNVKDLAAEYNKNPGRYHPGENVNGKAYIAFHADGPGRDPAASKSWRDFPYQFKWVIVEMDVVKGASGVTYDQNHGIIHHGVTNV